MKTSYPKFEILGQEFGTVQWVWTRNRNELDFQVGMAAPTEHSRCVRGTAPASSSARGPKPGAAHLRHAVLQLAGLPAAVGLRVPSVGCALVGALTFSHSILRPTHHRRVIAEPLLSVCPTVLLPHREVTSFFFEMAD